MYPKICAFHYMQCDELITKALDLFVENLILNKYKNIATENHAKRYSHLEGSFAVPKRLKEQNVTKNYR